MLFTVTVLLDAVALSLTLWMALYLFARGLSGAVTRRAVIGLLLMFVFFFSAYSSLFQQITGAAWVRQVAGVLTLGTWYGLTTRLMSARARYQQRRRALAIYILCAAAAVLIFGYATAYGELSGDPLSVPHLRPGPSFVLYPAIMLLTVAGIIYNLISDERVGLSKEGKFFLVSSSAIAVAIVYACLGLTAAAPYPRWVLDSLALGAVVLLGLSVARHQSLIERRTTLQDFPVSALAMFGISAFYVFLAWRLGMRLSGLGALLALVVVTHSIYDVVHEALERLHVQHETGIRRKLRELEDFTYDDGTLHSRLQRGLGLLCQTVHAKGGFIALRHSASERYTVAAQIDSLYDGALLDPSWVACDDVKMVSSEWLPGIVWIAPAFVANTQVALIGLGEPEARLEYSADNLDLLAEVADHIGTIVSLSTRHAPPEEEMPDRGTQASGMETRLRASTDVMLAIAAYNVDAGFIKKVEEALRHLSDYVELGGSELAQWAGSTAPSEVDRGKSLSALLRESIERLRPAPERPPGTLPREWYNYQILHDAYVEGVPNRVIMNKLYISEGTFNRTRRTAIRGLARILLDNVSGSGVRAD